MICNKEERFDGIINQIEGYKVMGYEGTRVFEPVMEPMLPLSPSPRHWPRYDGGSKYTVKYDVATAIACLPTIIDQI